MASIEKRGDNTYRVTVSSGYDDKGKKIRKHKTIALDPKLTPKQAEKELQRQAALFEEEVKKGTYYEPSKLTLSGFISMWLEEKKKTIQNKTLLSYKSLLKGRVVAAMGNIKLSQIRPTHLMSFYDNLQEDGMRDDGKDGKLSNNTILHYHRALFTMFSDAVMWGLIKENPCSKVRPPKVTKIEMNTLDESQVSLFLDALETESIKSQTIIILSLMTGCRRGELAGLQWKHIDMKNNIITIQQAVSYTPDTGTIIKPPKNKSSVRKVAIDYGTVELLKQYRKYWLEEKVKVGDQWQKKSREAAENNSEVWIDPEYLFTTWNGYIIHPDTLTKKFKKFIKRHNLENIRLHDLRHTAATILIHSGLNIRAIAGRLGHANPSTTLNIYSHALLSTDRQAADIMGGLNGKKNETKQVE